MPTEIEIEQCLRRTTRDALNGDEVTINGVRQLVEEELDLESGFLKNATWKIRSKQIVEAAFNDPASPEQVKKAAPKQKSSSARAGAKRKSDEAQPSKKRRRKAASEEREDERVVEEHLSSGEEVKIPLPSQGSDNHDGVSKDESEPSEADDNDQEAEQKTRSTDTIGADADDDSDMSVVFDDPLPPKKRLKKATSTKPTAVSKASSKPSKHSTSSKALSADEEEIKRLQGWLIKCGMRKMWTRELAPFSTSKEKTKHLRKMLEDVGMTGRYSAEKAKQIKEARELEAEIQSAQEFNQAFGHKADDSDDDDDDENDSGERKPTTRPKRAVPKGLVDFGDSGDEGSD